VARLPILAGGIALSAALGTRYRQLWERATGLVAVQGQPMADGNQPDNFSGQPPYNPRRASNHTPKTISTNVSRLASIRAAGHVSRGTLVAIAEADDRARVTVGNAEDFAPTLWRSDESHGDRTIRGRPAQQCSTGRRGSTPRTREHQKTSQPCPLNTGGSESAAAEPRCCCGTRTVGTKWVERRTRAVGGKRVERRKHTVGGKGGNGGSAPAGAQKGSSLHNAQGKALSL
jgi:hypothetical protein